MSSYCPACGDVAETRAAIRFDREVSECVACSFILDLAAIQPDSEGWAYAPPSTILFADDSDVLRGAIEAALLEKELSQSVLGARDGAEFLEVFTWHLKDGNPVQLVMLDVDMPKLDGYASAIALRAVERAFDLQEKTPIVFFSARRCDAHARSMVLASAPAVFINKMASPDLSELAMRVEAVMLRMLRRRIAA